MAKRRRKHGDKPDNRELWQELVDVIYDSTAGRKRAIVALTTLGKTEEEAQTICSVLGGIAEKSQDRDGFRAILLGKAKVPVELTAQEYNMLRTPSRRIWEGDSGDTWEGSDGNTWQGSGGNTWQGSSL